MDLSRIVTIEKLNSGPEALVLSVTMTEYLNLKWASGGMSWNIMNTHQLLLRSGKLDQKKFPVTSVARHLAAPAIWRGTSKQFMKVEDLNATIVITQLPNGPIWEYISKINILLSLRRNHFKAKGMLPSWRHLHCLHFWLAGQSSSGFGEFSSQSHPRLNQNKSLQINN